MSSPVTLWEGKPSITSITISLPFLDSVWNRKEKILKWSELTEWKGSSIAGSEYFNAIPLCSLSCKGRGGKNDKGTLGTTKDISTPYSSRASSSQLQINKEC
jgi:hypothetical protein